MTRPRLVLVGGGDLARELLCWMLQAEPNLPQQWQVGFIDDGVDQLRAAGLEPTSLGTIAAFQPQPDDELLLTIASPAIRCRVQGVLAARAGRFRGFRHPSALVASTAQIGEGVILCPLSVISEATRLEAHVIVNSFSSVGHDAVIGAFSTLSAHVDITGHAQLGRRVFVGSGARVLPGKQVGDGAVVGAGATVMRNLAEGKTLYAPLSRLL
ncbi:MAG: acetyltransferase [Cyanobacteriota bacterium]|nr:acetyltransferase [Cyanobacteriota bacterium]